MIIATFTSEFFARVRDWGLESEVPVFVFGLPRSGTTLIEQILASHSAIHGAGELGMSGQTRNLLAGPGGSSVPEAILAVNRLDRAGVHRIAESWLRELQAHDTKAARIVDKMPENYVNLGLLAALFPRARFIHCQRDVRDVAVSCWFTNFKQVNWANDQDAIVSRFREYRRLMAHWRRVLPVPILEVSYEDVVADLETQARRLIAGCGLEWEPACLAFHQTRRAVHTASMTQVRQPIYSRSVGRWRNYSEALASLFARLEDQEQQDEGAASVQEAIKLDPSNAERHYKEGKALQEQGKFEAAADSYRRAVQLWTYLPEAQADLSVVLTRLDRPEEAAASLQEALRLKPNFPQAYNNLGDAQVQMGDIAGAEASFRAAARLDPRYACSLAPLLGARLPDSELDALRGVLTAPELRESERCQVHYSLAQVHDARGEHAEAARHAERANALDRALRVKRGQTSDPAAHADFVDLNISTFTPDFFHHVRGWGVESEIPVFVFGLPRSGTTLVEQILASHSRVHGAGERALSWDAFCLLAKNKDAEEQVSKVRAEEAFAVLGTDRERVHRVAASCLERLRGLHSSASRVVDKMPDNYLYLGLLATLFPQARFIHCRRDLRDVALSCWLTTFKRVDWANDQDAIVSRFREYRRLMAHWRRVLPVPILEVSYEDVVADLETQARRLVSGCGLEWEPACLAFHQTRRPVHTASAIQVRQPIYSRSVGRWRNYADALRPLFAQLGAF